MKPATRAGNGSAAVPVATIIVRGNRISMIGPKASVTAPRGARSIDGADGRAQYGRRFATVEPVVANLRHNKGLARFTLLGRAKVDGQWKLFCLVCNIEKRARAAYAA